MALSASSPLWPKGGWPMSWGQAGSLHQIGISTQRPSQFAADLGAFEGVGRVGYEENLPATAPPPGSWRPIGAGRMNG